MRKIIIFLIMLLCSYLVHANPGSYHSGSSGMLVPFRINTVTLLSEEIDITIDKFQDYIYFVQFNCSFELMNVSGKKLKIKIGFPVQYSSHQSAYGQIWLREEYQDDLTLHINGNTASYESTIYGLDPEPEVDDILYEELYFFDVDFDSNERKHIDVRYSMTVYSGLPGSDTIIYVLTTAKTWKGPIEKATFRISCSFPVANPEQCFKKFGVPVKIDNSNPPGTVITFVFHKFVPESNLQFSMYLLDSEKSSPGGNTVVMQEDTLQQALALLEQSNSFYSAYKINAILDKYKKSSKQEKEKSTIDSGMIEHTYAVLSDFYNGMLDNSLLPLSFKMSIISYYDKNNSIVLNSAQIGVLHELDNNEKKSKTRYRIDQIKRIARLLENNKGNRKMFGTACVLAEFLQLVNRSDYKEYFAAARFPGDKESKVLEHYYTGILTDVFAEENLDNRYINRIFYYLETYYPPLLDFFTRQIEIYTNKIWHTVKAGDRKKLEYVLNKCDVRETMGFGLDFNEHEDLVRKAYYVLANSYIRENPEKAVELYEQAFLYTWSNTEDIVTPSYLLAIDLFEWEHEGEANAPCYYIAYNMCCACTLSGDIPSALKWLRVSLRLNVGLQNIILSDKDIRVLRNEYSADFNRIVEDELGISLGPATVKKTLTREEALTMTLEESLYEAIWEGNVDAVKKLVESGAEVNKMVEGTTPLIIASRTGNLSIVRFLLSHKADVTITTRSGYSAFLPALYDNNTEIVKLFLNAGVNLKADCYKETYPLHVATDRQNLELIILFIQNGISVNQKNSSGRTPLMNAAGNGNMDIARYLIQNKAGLNEQDNNGNTALMYACSGNYLELFKFLVDQGATINLKNNEGKSVIVCAAEEENREIVQFLLTCKPVCTKEENLFIQNFLGQKRNPDIELLRAVKAGDLKKTREWIKQGAHADAKTKEGYPALFFAVTNGYNDIVKELITSGADVHQCFPGERTVLSMAVYCRQFELVRYLVEDKKCPVNHRNLSGSYTVIGSALRIKDPVACKKMLKYLFSKGAKTNPGILREAIRDSTTTSLQILVENGADIDGTVDWGYNDTPLMFAVEKSKPEMVRWLITHGADINKGNNYRDTPLFKAVTHNNSRMVKLLLREGADINRKNIYNKTALDYAVSYNREELVTILLACGGKSGE
ncbi:MAG: ankyrin repeat domain-containing protein [Spirochaetales bacterium]|nr:ankyrin repeat domain-containing protein [Spirochaetales bacterium]